MRFKKGLIDIANNDNKVKKGSMGALIWLFIFCKTNLKKIFFLKKYLFFTKYTLLAEKMFLYGKKKVLY